MSRLNNTQIEILDRAIRIKLLSLEEIHRITGLCKDTVRQRIYEIRDEEKKWYWINFSHMGRYKYVDRKIMRKYMFRTMLLRKYSAKEIAEMYGVSLTSVQSTWSYMVYKDKRSLAYRYYAYKGCNTYQQYYETKRK